MTGCLRITVLADNRAAGGGFHAEHGLSLLLETETHRVLFDTGQGASLPANAAGLGIDLDPLDALVLSHGHYDHTGGVAWLLRACPPGRIFVHPAALGPKFARRQPPPHRDIGIPRASLEALNAVRDRIVWTATPAEVVPGVWCTGEIPRRHPAPPPEGYFHLDAECREPDPLVDDQALFVTAGRGVAVIAGCMHAGVANTLDYIGQLTGSSTLSALAGGLHLNQAPQNVLQDAGDAIERWGIQSLAPCHCTGPAAHAYLGERFGSQVHEFGAGSVFNLA